MDAKKLKEIHNKKGMLWLISALVYGSIGYFSPDAAKTVLIDAMNGELKNFSERCYACFKCDLMGMIEYDINAFIAMEKINTDFSKEYMERITQIEKMDLMQQTTIGLMML